MQTRRLLITAGDKALLHGNHDHDSIVPQNKKDAQSAIIACGITLLIGGILIVMKLWAYVQTDSAAVLSSLLDSFIDVGVSALNMGAIIYALQPPDKEHRYGHGKMEGVSALVQAALIAGSAVFLIIEAFLRLAEQRHVEQPLSAIAVMAVSSLFVIAIVLVQKRAAKRSKSLALEADTGHYASDLALNAGVAATLLCAVFGAPFWVDGLFALLVSAWIGKTSWEVGHKALSMLLDEELPCDTRDKIAEIVRAHPLVLGMHDLRTRRSGAREVINIDVEINPDFKLSKAHAISQEVEAEILKFLPMAEIMIHLDPYGMQHSDSRHGNKNSKS